MRTAYAEASPSLALIKYWGKQEDGVNIPATTSIAVGLDALRTRTTVRTGTPGHAADMPSHGTGTPSHAAGTPHHTAGTGLDESPDFSVTVDGEIQDPHHFSAVINALRSRARELGVRRAGDRLDIESHNNFPTAAGVASSSSGFAALVLALDAYFELNLEPQEASRTAREGSGSAARSVYDGFTRFDAGASAARQLYPADYWPELRVLVALTDTGRKPTGSRSGMNHTRNTSPFYRPWVDDSFSLAEAAARALGNRDIEALGTHMRESYLRMTGTMLAASPAVIYWKPESLALIELCARLREQGIAAWETMDAGPQVKILTTDTDLAAVRDAVEQSGAARRTIESAAGGTVIMHANETAE